MALWYYSIDGVQHGPAEDDEMRAMLASGIIGTRSLVWKDGMEGWQALELHPEWVAHITSPTGTPLPSHGVLQPTNGLAIASMVCGLISLPMMAGCWVGILTAIPAVICGHMALSQMKRMPSQGGRGFAITGLVTGYLAILATLAVLLLFGALIVRDIK